MQYPYVDAILPFYEPFGARRVSKWATTPVMDGVVL
jgi:hypothetical protein